MMVSYTYDDVVMVLGPKWETFAVKLAKSIEIARDYIETKEKNQELMVKAKQWHEWKIKDYWQKPRNDIREQSMTAGKNQAIPQ